MRLRPHLLAFSFSLASLLGILSWLLYCESGLQTIASLLSSPRLEIQGAKGRLLGPIEIERIHWLRADGFAITASDLALDWSPLHLVDGELRLDRWQVRQLSITPSQESHPEPPPASLRLPFALHLASAEIARLDYGKLPAFTELKASLSSDGRTHRLDAIHLRSGELTVNGNASLDGEAPFQLTAQARITGEAANKPLAIHLEANGPLAGISLSALAEQGIQGKLSGELTPFSSAPFSRLSMQVKGINPASWQASWPHGLLDLQAELLPAGNDVQGQFSLANRQAARLDQGGIPIQQIEGRLLWHAGKLDLDQLRLQLPGNGSLQGKARWQAEALGLKFSASRIDVAQLHNRLRPTRLDGDIEATLKADLQHARIDLRDPRFSLRGEGSLKGERWALSTLEIAAGEARLTASADGHKAGEFKLQARLQAFDPARFARLPSARINADLKLSGQGQAPWQTRAEFRLSDSQWAGLPLLGGGLLQLNSQGLQDSDLELSLGENQLKVKGAFGLPGQQAHLQADLPQPAPLGLTGSLKAEATLSGTMKNAQLEAHLNSPQLGLPDGSRLRDLKLTARLGNRPDAPIALKMQLARLDRPNLPGLLRDLLLQADGSNDQHQIHLFTHLLEGDSFRLSAQGGTPDLQRWQGEIRNLQIDGSGKQTARNLRLKAPVPLLVSPSFWRFGPMQLQGDPLDWQATLAAQADQKNLKLALSATGSRIGELTGRLGMSMSGPYHLASDAPWQGEASVRMPDISWLGEVIGEGWQSSGKVSARFTLGGSPNSPRLSGQIAGEMLGLHLPETGLRLNAGELRASLQDNLLHIERLHFLSPWQNLPRALRNASLLLREPEALKQLTASPGHLEITGQMQLDQGHATQASRMQLKLDRVGVYQLPDRWASISGETELSLQASQLGLQGTLAADAGYWQLAPGGAPRLSDDVVVRRNGEVQESGWRPRLTIDLNTRLGDRFLFEGLGLSSRLIGEVRITARDRDLPRASGSIHSRQGSFSAYGQKLDIERGSLHFRGLLDNPALDIRALRKGLPVEAGVQISGTAQKPGVRLVSDPELPDAEKLSWLILGHGPEQSSGADATVLLAAAGGLLGNDAGNLVGQLKKTFNLDEFALRQGRIGDNNSHTATSRVAGSNLDTSNTGSQIVSIGKRLSSNAVLSYEQSVGRAESVVKLAVRLSQRLTLVGRAGSDNALDLFYTLFFGRDENARTGQR